jgi:5-methylcytosine-specific restriction endonuclease McrA
LSYYQCPYCEKQGNRLTKHVDHIIPLSRGGCNCRENKVISCWECNSRKHDKTPLEYFTWLNGIGHFEYWGYTKREKKHLLGELAELEIKAIEHMRKIHGIKPSFWD